MRLCLGVLMVLFCNGCFIRSVVVVERLPVIVLDDKPEVGLDGVDVDNLNDQGRVLLDVAYQWAKYARVRDARIEQYNIYAVERNKEFDEQRGKLMGK